MLNFLDRTYYIDFDMVMRACQLEYTGTNKQNNKDENEETDEEDGEENLSTTPLEINIFKYEMIKMCIERVLTDYENEDNEMNLLKKESLSLKIATATLIKNNILIEFDEDNDR